MWYDDPFVKFKNTKGNRRTSRGRKPILMVNARLAEQRRDRAQRVFVMTVLTLSFAGGAWATAQAARMIGRQAFAENERYTIRRLDLTADSQVIPERLIREWAEYPDEAGRMVQVKEGDNLFAIDLVAVREAILRQFAVKDAIVTRQLPDTLAIHVMRRVPIARLGPETLPFTFDVDRDGYLVGRSGATSAGLPRIIGLDPQAPRTDGRLNDAMAIEALRLLDLCASARSLSDLIRIDRIGVGHPDYLQLELRSGEYVMFGPENMTERLATLAGILKGAAARGESLQTINLTVDRNIPITPRS